MRRFGDELVVGARFGWAPERLRAWRAGLRCSPATLERLEDAVRGKRRPLPLDAWHGGEDSEQQRALRAVAATRFRAREAAPNDPRHLERVARYAERVAAGLGVFGTEATPARSTAWLEADARGLRLVDGDGVGAIAAGA